MLPNYGFPNSPNSLRVAVQVASTKSDQSANGSSHATPTRSYEVLPQISQDQEMAQSLDVSPVALTPGHLE